MKSYNNLVEKYPKIFTVKPGAESLPYSMFGIECGIGWYNIIDNLCFQIQSHIDWRNSQRALLLGDNPYDIKIPHEVPQVIVAQIKEKYGALRFYYHGGDERIDGMVRMAEAMSAATCEHCGNIGKPRGKNWIYTACDEHTKEGD